VQECLNQSIEPPDLSEERWAKLVNFTKGFSFDELKVVEIKAASNNIERFAPEKPKMSNKNNKSSKKIFFIKF
jgi:hypothetical protein